MGIELDANTCVVANMFLLGIAVLSVVYKDGHGVSIDDSPVKSRWTYFDGLILFVAFGLNLQLALLT